jgi:hypothetical protein
MEDADLHSGPEPGNRKQGIESLWEAAVAEECTEVFVFLGGWIILQDCPPPVGRVSIGRLVECPFVQAKLLIN